VAAPLADGLAAAGLPDGGLLDGGFPDGGVASLPGALDALELPDPLPNFAFLSTKLPPPAPLALALDGLLDVSLLLDDPPARCRQPVALVAPGVAPADGCGVDVVGLCAASVPQSATALLSVTAHRHCCVFFMTPLLLLRVRSAVHAPGSALGPHPTSRRSGARHDPHSA
jgi:hypothetical protein